MGPIGPGDETCGRIRLTSRRRSVLLGEEMRRRRAPAGMRGSTGLLHVAGFAVTPQRAPAAPERTRPRDREDMFTDE